jgi:hypothetical protein
MSSSVSNAAAPRSTISRSKSGRLRKRSTTSATTLRAR